MQYNIPCVKTGMLFMLAQWDRADQLERYDLRKWTSPDWHPSVVLELVKSEPNCCLLCQGDGPVSLKAANLAVLM